MLIYIAAFLTVLIGCCGLMLDVGLMEGLQVQIQNAADAAAVGGAYALQSGSPVVATGTADATLNGFTQGVNNATVNISNPPGSGAYAGVSSAVQATITQPLSATFLPSLFTISAKATALVPPTPCVYLLSQYYSGHSLDAVNQTITGDCPFYIGLSYRIFGGSSNSSGSQFLLHGDIANSTGSVTPAPINSAAMGDPLAYVPQPAFGTCQYTNTSVTSAATLQPGTYCGGLTINTTANVTLAPGVYVVAGNLTINGPTITGAGVTFFMTAGGGSSYGVCSITTYGNVSLSAPTTGSWQGILFFSDRSMPPGQPELSLANWKTTSRVDGILYLVGQELLSSNIPLQGNNYLGIVADYFSIHNTGFVVGDNYSTLANGNPFKAVGTGLVE
jgi:hypothetical protein